MEARTHCPATPRLSFAFLRITTPKNPLFLRKFLVLQTQKIRVHSRSFVAKWFCFWLRLGCAATPYYQAQKSSFSAQIFNPNNS